MSVPPADQAGLTLRRRVLLLLCAAGFLVFLLPVFGGIVNIANQAAMGGFLLLGAVILWWPRFLRGLLWLWKRLWGRLLLLVSGAGLLALAGALLVLCGLVISGLRAAPESPCPTLIVLGCQVRGSRPSQLLGYRIRAAADYLNANAEAVAVLSGGRGSNEDISEAQCMYEQLLALGIAPERLYREEASATTLENLRFSQALMRREGLSGPVLLVSNDWHLWRARKMAEDLGMQAQGLPARSNWYSRPTYILREAMAALVYLLEAR